MTTWSVYKWEWERDPGPFFGRWASVVETDAEDQKNYYVNELQRDEIPVLVIEND